MEQQAPEGNGDGAAPKTPHWTHTYEKWDGWKDPDEAAKKRDEEAKRLKNYRENNMSCAHDRSAERKVMEMPIEEKLEACREFRRKGNLFHEEGQYRRAALQYRQALIYYDFCFPDKEEEQQELDDIQQACLLNSAACFLACGELDQTMDCCYQALRAEPDNVKALYRRAVVYRLRDQFKEASADLGKALAQLPNEVALRKESAVLKSKIASYRERSKAMGEQIFRKEQGTTGNNDGGPSSLSNAGTTSPLDGENHPTREELDPSEGDGEVVRNERGSVFTAGRVPATATAPAWIGRGGGRDSKHQQGRRRHDLSLVEMVDLKEDYVEFILSNTDTSVANALRRVMIAEVPTMAIDLVTIHDNSSVLQDEFLSHRLGLIPLVADRGVQYDYNYDCDCEDYCSKCSAVFTLDVSWEKKSRGRPEHMQDQPVHVTSADLVGSDPRLHPVHFAPSDQTNSDISQDAGIIIAKLAKGQRMQLTAVAKKGIAKEHAKWSPVAVATYKFEPIIEINEEREALLTPDQKAEFVEICPAKVYSRDDKSGTIYVENRDMCMYCDDCVYLAKTYKTRPEDDPVVKIRPSEDRFIFSVETNGSMTAEDVVITALKVISEKLLGLRNDLMRMGDDQPWKQGE